MRNDGNGGDEVCQKANKERHQTVQRSRTLHFLSCHTSFEKSKPLRIFFNSSALFQGIA